MPTRAEHNSQKSAAPLIEVADLNKLPPKGAIINGYHALPGLDGSFDTYLRRALLMAIILRPLRVSSDF